MSSPDTRPGVATRTNAEKWLMERQLPALDEAMGRFWMEVHRETAGIHTHLSREQIEKQFHLSTIRDLAKPPVGSGKGLPLIGRWAGYVKPSEDGIDIVMNYHRYPGDPGKVIDVHYRKDSSGEEFVTILIGNNIGEETIQQVNLVFPAEGNSYAFKGGEKRKGKSSYLNFQMTDSGEVVDRNEEPDL